MVPSPLSAKAPDRLLPLQLESWPSLQLSGVIQLKLGTVLSTRSLTRPSLGLSRLAMWLASQFVPPLTGSVRALVPLPPTPVSDSNQPKGKCLATYWSEYSGLLALKAEPSGPVPLPATREAAVYVDVSANPTT